MLRGGLVENRRTRKLLICEAKNWNIIPTDEKWKTDVHPSYELPSRLTSIGTYCYSGRSFNHLKKQVRATTIQMTAEVAPVGDRE